MGRHSMRRQVRHWKRMTHNVLAVSVVTILTTVAVFVALTTKATIEQLRIPDPTVSAGVALPVMPDTSANTQQNTQQNTQTVPETNSDTEADTDSSATMRRCPATGCAAPTCHGETGDPPPGQ